MEEAPVVAREQGKTFSTSAPGKARLRSHSRRPPGDAAARPHPSDPRIINSGLPSAIPFAAMLLLESAPQESCTGAHEDLPTCQQIYSDDVEFCTRDGAQLTARATETEAQLAGQLSADFALSAAGQAAWCGLPRRADRRRQPSGGAQSPEPQAAG